MCLFFAGESVCGLDIVRTAAYSGPVSDWFFGQQLSTVDTLSARSTFGVGRTCALVSDGRDVLCWATAGSIPAWETSQDSMFRLSVTELSGLPGRPTRFLHVSVARDVWLITDSGSIVVIFHAGSGGSYSMRLPTWPPLASAFGAPRPSFPIGVITDPDTPFLRVSWRRSDDLARYLRQYAQR